ncbi:MAG TPA: BON domain-containing protein [Steroidobacteraceae bacterium]
MSKLPALLAGLVVVLAVEASEEGRQEPAGNEARNAADETRETLNEAARSDPAITARVKAALIGNEEIESGRIDIQTQEGIVQLSGFVDSDEMKQAAGQAAREVPGVREVRNQLVVQAADRTIGEATDDTVIAAKVKSQLASESGLETASDVDVEVSQGVVQLSGFVSSEDEKSEAEHIARGVSGVTDVRNDIRVQPER